MLSLLVLVYLSNHVDRQILSILLEPIKQEFGASDTMMGLLTGTAFALFYAFAGIPIARWADRGTRRSIIALGAIAWSAMTVCSGLARSFGQLALFRVGVGIGEAACTPPSHSLIADYFPPRSRGRALGIYSAGIQAGVAFGLLVGGWLYHLYGWRTSFVLVGLPGIVLGLLVRLTVREPRRGAADAAPDDGQMSTREAFRFLLQQRSYVHQQLGTALHGMSAWALSVWMIPFWQRVHGLEIATVTTWLGLIALFVGMPGMALGGWLSDRLTPRDPRWYCWLPTGVALGALPFTALFLFVPDWRWALVAVIPHSLLGMTFNAPVYAMIQAVSRPRVRALAVAVHLFVGNLMGLGLGPLLVGALNDGLRATHGDHAIRYTMLVAGGLNLLASVFYLLAARSVRGDIARALREDAV